MDNYQQNFMNSLVGGLRFGQALKAQRDQTQVNRLAGQAYSAAPEQRSALLGQIAQVSPDAAYQQEQNFASSDERRNQTMVNMAKLLTGAPEQARPGLWRQFVPTLSQFGLSELPPEYNEQTRNVIEQAAQSLVQAYGPASSKTEGRVVGRALVNPVTGEVMYKGEPDPANLQYVDVPDGNGGSYKRLLDPRTGQFSQPNFDGSATTPPRSAGVTAGTGANQVRVQLDGIPPERQQQIANVASAMQAAGYTEQQVMGWISEATDTDATAAGFPPTTVSTPPSGRPGYTPPKPREAEAESFGQPQAVVNPQTGKRELVQFGNRGGVRRVGEYAPEPAKGEGTGDQANNGLNDRQRVAVQGVQRNLIQYAAALTGIPAEQLQGMSAQDIAKAVQSKGGRFVQGGVARVMGNFPGGQTTAQVQNSDILSYSQGAGAAWAAYENPTGIITNADRETATAQMPNYLDPPEVQAAKIRSFLELSGWDGRGTQQAPSAPSNGSGGWGIKEIK